KPMAPRPSMPTLPGRVSRSNRLSVVSSRSPSAARDGGTTGPEPVATMKARAWMDRPPTSTVSGPVKRAVPMRSRSLAISRVRLAVLSASRSRVWRAWLHRSFGVADPVGAAASFRSARRLAHWWPACSAAFEGMQPTRPHVVPNGPWSIRTADRPRRRNSLKAVRPAVPAPMTATSMGMDDGMSGVLVHGAKSQEDASPALVGECRRDLPGSLRLHMLIPRKVHILSFLYISIY